MSSNSEGEQLEPVEASPTILVVDDSVSSARLLQLYLKRDGYRVVLAESGEEALAKVRSHSPDLITLDVMMPGLDGFAVCERLKTDPDTRFIPVILVTALNQMQDRIRGIEAGADVRPPNRAPCGDAPDQQPGQPTHDLLQIWSQRGWSSYAP